MKTSKRRDAGSSCWFSASRSASRMARMRCNQTGWIDGGRSRTQPALSKSLSASSPNAASEDEARCEVAQAIPAVDGALCICTRASASSRARSSSFVIGSLVRLPVSSPWPTRHHLSPVAVHLARGHGRREVCVEARVRRGSRRSGHAGWDRRQARALLSARAGAGRRGRAGRAPQSTRAGRHEPVLVHAGHVALHALAWAAPCRCCSG